MVNVAPIRVSIIARKSQISAGGISQLYGVFRDIAGVVLMGGTITI
jgi:hypothetical protein